MPGLLSDLNEAGVVLEGLGKRFGNEWVFRGANLRIPRGGSAVVVGPSGGGKSVLLKLAAGLLEPDEGTARLASSRVSMLFQKNALFDSMTALENLLLPLRERDGRTTPEHLLRAREGLRQVGLEKSEALYPDELSGGMQKRLGIARAQAVDPEIVIYDEPTAGLDPITSRSISDLIKRLAAEKRMTLLIVCNDRSRALALGDQIYLLARGELIAAGTPSEVARSENPSVVQFFRGLKEGPLT